MLPKTVCTNNEEIFEFWRPFYLDHIKTKHIHKFDLVITYKQIIHSHKENLFSLQIERIFLMKLCDNYDSLF